MKLDRIYKESEIQKIPSGFRVLEVVTPSGKFYCLTGNAKRLLQEKYPATSTTIFKEGVVLNGCGLGS